MRKLFLTLVLVGLGAATWWVVARTARFSIKKWDAKFETVLRHGLTSVGLDDDDILSSIHEIRKDPKGEWVAHQLTIQKVAPDKMKELARGLEESGAKVEEKMQDGVQTLVVKRGSRVYQEIHFR